MERLVESVISEYSPLVHVYKPFEYVSDIYGMEVYAITPEQIEALKNGDALYLEIQGEYAALIHMQVKGARNER